MASKIIARRAKIVVAIRFMGRNKDGNGAHRLAGETDVATQSHQFTTPHFSQRYADNAMAIATSVYSGCASMLPAVENEHFSFVEWQECATDAVEYGNVGRFRDMLAEEQAHSDFTDGQQAGRISEFADFDEWLAGSRDNYWFTDTALSAAKWDGMFATVNAGHRAFARGGAK